VTFVFGCFCVQFTPASIDKKTQLIIGNFFIFFTLLLVGPSKLIDLPNTVTVMAIGQAL